MISPPLYRHAGYAVLTSMLLLFGACSSSKTPAPVSQKSGPAVVRDGGSHQAKGEGGAIRQTREGMPGAVASPLTDLNLRKPVPPDTLEKLGYVYTVNRGLNCTEIARQIDIIDRALGELDADVIAAEEIKQKGDGTSQTALDVIGSIASSIIPLRPLVRTATGARKAKKHYDERFDNGRRRRAFLKGYGLGKRCKPPAAPLLTYVPYWGKQKPVDPKVPNKRWKDSYVAPAGK